MTYEVLVLPEAEDDLVALHRYVGNKQSLTAADKLLKKLERACATLARHPSRGHVPPELERIGVTAYLELSVAPYRIFYDLDGTRVYVHAIIDGRRDLETILWERLSR